MVGGGEIDGGEGERKYWGRGKVVEAVNERG